MRFKTIAKLTILLALVMFFTPFIMVSCSEFEVEETYTGADLMMRIVEEDDGLAEREADAYDDFNYNYWLIGAFVLGVVTLIVLFLKKGSIIAGITSLIATILLVAFRLTFVSFYELEEIEKYITIKTKWGYIVCLALMFLTAILAFIDNKKEKNFY